MRFIKSRVLLAGAASLLALGACNSEQKAAAPAAKEAAAPVVQEDAVATVNGTAITKARVDMIVKQGASTGQPDTPEMRRGIIEHLTAQMLIAEEAVKKGLDKMPEISEQFDMLRQSILANAYVQDFIKTHPVSEEMLKAEYERMKEMAAGSEYKARHILVETEAEARDIIARLKKDPAAFEKLAREKSKDPGSKANGGELGWFDTGSMVPEFGSAASKLEKGSFTQEPVHTQFGYHVILLEDTRPVQAPPFDQVKADLAQHLQQQQLTKLLDDLKAKAKIAIVEASAPAAAPAATPAAAPAPASAGAAGK
ncbi:MAG: putative parvulin-type peptidyl-prolyl cis-trans isomerase precursor [Candidatus Accumulibacter regalis]|jgi:peptidyl-prolyl cis-trans isomerase C|uniref:peptidylprolyl isomerase n=1 Tax=Accumulibacter regalis TaxID=522306 RepID=A0A011PM08_ACCRE|nr:MULTISPECIES: peptidylprolyl isomerase [unclassified Candidatus Accumulibacter]EXI88476.1 MAG: putative parvulin-type peptidyl-prolyl cis-trans isomerase precursor [Candidatus Accumulibacter regalis]HRE71023.1 peptidylprolyl isomerase [Accumulibacter sp.]